MLVPENFEVLSLRHWVEYQSNTTVLKTIMELSERASVSIFVYAGSLYTGNELEKCLIFLYLWFSPI